MLGQIREKANALYVALVAVTFVAFLVTVLVFILGIVVVPGFLPWSLIESSQLYAADKDYPDTGIILPGWAWWLWLPLAIWLLIILIYGLITVARWRSIGYLYHAPRSHMPATFYAMLLANFTCVLMWVFVTSWGYIDMALGFMALATLSIILAEGLSWFALDDVILEFARQDKKPEIAFIRGVVHNGLGLYDVMCAVMTLLILGQVLVYRAGVGVETSGTVVLSLIALENVGWAIIDMVFMDRWARYVVAPYVVTPFWLLASLVSNPGWRLEDASRNASLSLVFLVTSVIMLVIKGIVTIRRHRRRHDPRMHGVDVNEDGAGSSRHHGNGGYHGSVASMES